MAEELGRIISPLPFVSSVFLCTEAVTRHASPAQQAQWLPALAAGDSIGCFALAQGAGNPVLDAVWPTVSDGRLSGSQWPVAGAMMADFAIVLARDEGGQFGLYHVELMQLCVQREPLAALDVTRAFARLTFACRC